MKLAWLVAMILSATTALAQQAYDSAKLDPLFASLKGASDQRAADTVVKAITRQWIELADREQRLLMELGIAEMRKGALPEAIVIFTSLIERAPGQPEPWHKRGTVRMLLREHALAIVDFCAAIRREPRHFGAYSNLGAVRVQTDEPELALAAYSFALRHNPRMPGIVAEIVRLEARLGEAVPAVALGCDQRAAGR